MEDKDISILHSQYQSWWWFVNPRSHGIIIHGICVLGNMPASMAEGLTHWPLEDFNLILGISYEIALRWMPLDLTDDNSALVQVMAWCRQATSHYLSKCWPRSMSPNGITRPQWVNLILKMYETAPSICVHIIHGTCISRPQCINDLTQKPFHYWTLILQSPLLSPQQFQFPHQPFPSSAILTLILPMSSTKSYLTPGGSTRLSTCHSFITNDTSD